MDNFFAALTLLSFIGMIVGFKKPSLFKLKSRKQALYIFGGAALLFCMIFGAISDKTLATKQTHSTQPSQVNSPETQETQQPAPTPKTLEEKITDAINTSLGSKTNTDKQRVVGIEINKYDSKMLSAYKYKKGDSVVGLLLEINADENITVNLQKRTMHHEAAQIAQAIFPLDQTVGDIIIWSRLPVQDKYGNSKDDTAIVYSISRPLFDKINWDNLDYSNLPTLLQSEESIDDRNGYFEKIKF